MAIKLVIPKSVKHSMYYKGRYVCVGIYAHNLQCGRRWVFLIRFNWRISENKWSGARFGYLTKGDATPDLLAYEESGWHWPWRWRYIHGRG